jgi:hypothetical protein
MLVDPRKYRLMNSMAKTSPRRSDHSLQLCDFEHIDWDPILSGDGIASSYITRKGLSRKAQLSMQIRKYLSKHPASILKKSIPYTLIIDTWNAFDEDMKIDFGLGMTASFDASCKHCPVTIPTMLMANLSVDNIQMPLRQRLEWCLDDIRAEIFDPKHADWEWIMKPSVTNKGVDITLLNPYYVNDESFASNAWSHLLDTQEALPDIREWVLQK